MKIYLKVYVNSDGTFYNRGLNDKLKPLFKLSNLVYHLQLVCPFSSENAIQVIFEKADNSITPYYNMSHVGNEIVGEELWNVFEFVIPSQVTELSSMESNYNKLCFNFYVQNQANQTITLNTEPYCITCNYSITGSQIQLNPVDVSDLLNTINTSLTARDVNKIFKVDVLPPETDKNLVGKAYMLTGNYLEVSSISEIEHTQPNQFYCKYVGESIDGFVNGKYYILDHNVIKEIPFDVEKNQGNIYLLKEDGYEIITFGSNIVALKEDLEKLSEEEAKNIKIFNINNKKIDEEFLSELYKYAGNAALYYNEGQNVALCFLLENNDETLIYRGNIATIENSAKTLTITINKETKSINYSIKENLESVNNDISVLKKNVNDLINGGALEAGGWVKIDGILKPEEVSALYQTKGTGFYTITSEEYGKEAVFIDTSKTMFKRQTGKYDYTYNFDTAQWEILASGTGGGSGTIGAVVLTNRTPLEATIAVGTSYKIGYDFSSTQDNKGTAQYYVDGTLRRTIVVNTGYVEFDVSDYIIAGERVVKVVVTDRYGNTNSLTYILIGLELRLLSKFDDTRAYSGVIDFRYTPYGVVEKKIEFIIDGETYKEETISISGEEQAINISGLSHAVHKLEVKMSAIVNGETIDSNSLLYNIIYVVEGNEEILISSKFDKTKSTQGELLSIDYIVYNPLSEFTNVKLAINDEEVSNLSVERSKQFWNLTNYPSGSVTFDIIAYRDNEPSQIKSFIVEVKEPEINVLPVTTNLELYLSAVNRNNSEELAKRTKWEYNEISATLNSFNWSTNGWLLDNKGNSVLRLNGKANVYIPFNIFETDFLGLGKTIEFDFATTDIYDINKLLVSCYANDKGFKITSNDSILKSEQTEVSTKFKEDERVRISFVIQASSTGTRLVKTFINGILSGLTQYPTNDEFKQANPVGITINNLEGSIDIYSIRIYSQDLTDKQMLNNYMSDLNLNEKIESYTKNNILDDYGQVAYSKVKTLIPVLIITGSLPGSKGDKKLVKATFENPFDSNYNFSFDDVEIDIQGTSSQFYPRKNYKLKFPTKFAFREGAVEEKTYTFKADYMESSHSHNTGNAKFINSISPKFPTQENNSKVRNTINGYPIVIFVRSNDNSNLEYYGVFNFNNDKGNSDTLGLTTPYAESWEFKNNTSARCLFRSNDFTNQVSVDFEARYPKDYKDYTNLSRVVSWVYSTENNIDKFKNEFAQYFNKEFCLFYYVMMDVMLAADSRAKNMFLDTADGQIWYPRWYDIDTTYGLNNEGVNQFTYGLEQHDFIEDVAVFNGEDSLLWNNFEEAFGDDIKTYYQELRSSGKLSYEAMINVLEGEQVSKISEAMYNTDGNFKYVGPLVEDNDSTYLYVEQGSRINHLKYWLSNRFNYLDSKYEYADFKNDFISMRAYTPDSYVVAPTLYFDIKPFTDMYVHVLFGSENRRVRGLANETTRIAPEILQKNNNTETIIYGASRILDVGDLSTKYARTMDFSKAVKLKRLQIGNATSGYQNTNLNELTIGNNTMLEYLDIRNCPNLTQSIDLSGCLNIKEVYASGTNISSINLAEGGNLITLQLPSSVTNLSLVNQPLLTNFSMPSYAAIKSLRLEKVAINSLPIVKAATQLERLRVVDVNWELTNAEQSLLDNLLNVRGFNADGSTSDKAVITGRIHVVGGVQDLKLKQWNKYFNNQETITPANPNVEIIVDNIIVTHTCIFKNYDGTILDTQYVIDGQYATYGGATPTKPKDEDYYYTFSTWYPSVSTAIKKDTEFTAQFTRNDLIFVIWQNFDGEVLGTNKVAYGETAIYQGATPTKPADEKYKTYVFIGWKDDYGNTFTENQVPNVISSKTLTAQFEGGEPQTFSVYWYNGDVLLEQDDNVPYGSTAEYNGAIPVHPDGYAFEGWGTDDFTIYGDTSFYAKFDKPIIYTLNLTDSTNLTPTVYISSYTGEGTVEWGDGTSLTQQMAPYDSGSVTFTKAEPYSEAGNYKIKILINAIHTGTMGGTYLASKYSKYITKCVLNDYIIDIIGFKDSQIKEIEIPISVTSIGTEAFYNCKSLPSINIPNSVTSIRNNAFYNCTSLTSINIPNSVTSIGKYVFYGCTNLTSINIPNSVTSIEDTTFYKCESLTNITIPDSVASIGTSALQIGSSSNKAIITFKSKTPPSIYVTTFKASYLKEIRVPMSAVETYKTATNWTTFADYIVGYEEK